MLLNIKVRSLDFYSGDQKLAEFLGDEISGERKLAPQKVSKIDGWDIKTDGTGVILTRKFNDES